VNNNLDKSISLEELAAVSYFSPFHFHRIFVALTGESVNNYTNRIRLEKATKLLRYSKNTISEIAFETGFSTPSTFSRAFKQYFGNSPSGYRKNGKIENSKIRKELFPVGDYHYDMKEEEMQKAFPVEIREVPQKRVAYIRVLDSFKDGTVIAACTDLIAWAKKANLYDSGEFFGMSLDDPMVTPKEKYRYEVGITIPDNFVVADDAFIETMRLPKTKYAVATVSGDFNLVATATNYIFNNWLINSNYEPDLQPGKEVFLDKQNICNWSHFDLDLCLPVKEIKTI